MNPNASLTVCASNGTSAWILKATKPMTGLRRAERRISR